MSPSLTPSDADHWAGRGAVRDSIRNSLERHGEALVSLVLEAERRPEGLQRLADALGFLRCESPVLQVQMLARSFRDVDIGECVSKVREAMPELFGPVANDEEPSPSPLDLEPVVVVGSPTRTPIPSPKVTPVIDEDIRPRYANMTERGGEISAKEHMTPADMVEPPQAPRRYASSSNVTWPEIDRRSREDRRRRHDRRGSVEVVYQNKRFGGERRAGDDRRKS